MDPLQTFVNSFVLVVLMIEIARWIWGHQHRHMLLIAWFAAIAVVNFVLLLRHYTEFEAAWRATVVGLIFVVLTGGYAALSHRLDIKTNSRRSKDPEK